MYYKMSLKRFLSYYIRNRSLKSLVFFLISIILISIMLLCFLLDVYKRPVVVIRSNRFEWTSTTNNSTHTSFVQSNASPVPAINPTELETEMDVDVIIDYHEDGLHPVWIFNTSKTYNKSELKAYSSVPKLHKSTNGPGEMGAAVIIPPEKVELANKLTKEYNLNVMASDMISLNRSLPDERFPECKNKSYPKKLPTTSVVMVFHNESWSILFRAVWSVINRSPRALLKEIILVDDFSDKADLKRALQDYIALLPMKVVLIRTQKRVGLIRARTIGATKAKGHVVSFLDANIECNDGWLEPILSRIASDRSVVAIPIIRSISSDTMAYYAGGSYIMYGFDFCLMFKGYPVPQRELTRVHHDKAAPFRTPTLIGCAFAIDREFFFEIGTYDLGLEIWGSENMEMSLRVWQCGGSLEIIPCSHMGHFFRTLPYSFNGDSNSIKIQNNIRVAEVWMDEYKEYFYKDHPGMRNTLSADSISDRIKLRKDLKCKNFQWFLKNVFPESDMAVGYKRIGQIQNIATLKCLDTLHKKYGGQIGIYPCHGGGNNQAFSHQNNGQIAFGETVCVGTVKANATTDYWLKVILMKCDRGDSKQIWEFDEKLKFYINQRSNLCLTTAENKAYLATCNISDVNQQWSPRSL